MLARRGARVVLVERSKPFGFRPGEHLPAPARRLVDRLGLLPADWASRHQAVPGFVNGWDDGPIQHSCSIMRPGAPGLCLDRARFDADLIEAGTGSGVDLRMECNVRAAEPTGKGWRLSVQSRQGMDAVSAKHLIVATGRSARLPDALAVERRRYGHIAFLACRMGANICDARPSLESMRTGWVFTCATPGPYFVMYLFFHPASGLPCARRLDALERLLEFCPVARSRLMTATRQANVQIEWRTGPAHSSLTFPARGKTWTILGDAAEARDPLSSFGLSNAFANAAEVVERLCRQARDTDPIAVEGRRLSAFSQYLQTRQGHLQAGTRWASEPIWQSADSIASKASPSWLRA